MLGIILDIITIILSISTIVLILKMRNDKK